MTDSASIAADFRRAIKLLAELNDPAATRVGYALRRWLDDGEDFEAACNLLPGWRAHLQLSARNTAVDELLRLLPHLTGKQLVAGVARGRLARTRPDGIEGYFTELARFGCFLDERQWRRVLAERRGHRDPLNVRAALK